MVFILLLLSPKMAQQLGGDASSYLFETPDKCTAVLCILQVLPVSCIQVTKQIAFIPTYSLESKSYYREK